MMRRRRGGRRRGATGVVVAVCLLPIVGATAMVLDGGMLMGQRRLAQAVADASAHAAAASLYNNYSSGGGLDPSGTAAAAARNIAADNGYANDATSAKAGNTSVVTVNIPPSSTSANFAGKVGCAEVVVTYYQPRYFTGIWGSASIPVTARAVAQVKGTLTGSILLTDPSMDGALTLTGGARLTANAAIQVNSSSTYSSSNPSKGAVNASNGAYLTDPGGLSVVGNVNIPSWASSSTFFSKAPTTGQAAAADPFAGVAAPTTSGLTNQSAPNPPYGSATLNPGVYNGGLTLGGGMTITMNPGIYYMKGGGLTVANGVRLTGSGVTIYIDNGGGSLSFQGGTTINLTAPSSGSYNGIVYFQDRANTSQLNNIANGATVNMTGAIYAPNSAMTIAGGASGASYGTQFIVKSLNLSNGVNVTINTPSGSGGGVSKPVIAE